MVARRVDSVFNLAKYDFVGFDLDNTLVTYNLRNLFTNHFEYLAGFLNAKKQYEIPALSPSIVDFMSRGLVIDINRGNLLKLNCEGGIIRASHGSRLLSSNEIQQVYGTEKKWSKLSEVIANRFSDWKSRSGEMYSFMDFTDAAATAVYALAVDSGRPTGQVWSDVYEAIASMYDDSEWENAILVGNPDRYVNKTPEKVKKWLLELRKHSKIGLVTSNFACLAPKIARNGLGDDFQSLFDVVVYEAKKPRFFYENVPFRDVETQEEVEFNFGQSFAGGSMDGIRENLRKILKREPNCLYLGDSPFHDYMTSSSTDTVAIAEELKAEKLFPGSHPSADFIRSSFWGSYFYEDDRPTLFGEFVLNAKFCVPDLEFLADKPVDFDFSRPKLLKSI
ncbi:unnamed protein product [Nesidiocoris tenuis]|uniref:5'-nucleotidase domain-containing protein 1 n=1 Tax=Nesidiocoris tenuis TaxID=355587 RepID=A0A6H5HKY7_9HEMI|nr:unnamed protein product [Nesidiocoris tenuis]